MIFVTVGMHEQAFDRLIRTIDNLKAENIINDDVIMQTGYSSYTPKHCLFKSMMSHEEMNKNVQNAAVVITHGGPGSILLAWSSGKKPIVVPRNPMFKEHVDNHQILFARRLYKEKKIVLVENIEDLKSVIQEVKAIDCKFQYHSNTEAFTNKLSDVLKDLTLEV
ncbi:PssE/Cps14G family polysaccharide biosynthesis glycosyltransferase [Clostridium thermarum]|uniref:PssE/Cps14G family polysaccharide biosynthesis glycosyltransferase n=1 Tax=Clostridium thermarum TaxID=1716543 RepID=UPI0013D75A56|nr:PssE/Cps14G family polysaccharide biosynthesis glycosyltransferase [Clostridium thermarum]